MNQKDCPLSDEQLLLTIDGELAPSKRQQMEAHLSSCWTCRMRKQELEGAISAFVRTYRQRLPPRVPSGEGPRALLKAQLAEAGAPRERVWWNNLNRIGWTAWPVAAIALVILIAGVNAARLIGHRPPMQMAGLTVPNHILTPGATVLADAREICRSSNTNNKEVPSSLKRHVFEEYGITRADPRAYEVDYLITPALGGADDIHNLWPQSYSSVAWNAEVKDALEDRLRMMVCDGQIDLATAQKEIAMNWIAAYQKYFHTDLPIVGRPLEGQ